MIEISSPIDYNQITAIATVATALIALVGLLFGALEFWRGRSTSELESNLRLQSLLNVLVLNMRSAQADGQRAVAENFLEICEVYAASLLKRRLPTLSREFTRDFLRYDLLPLLDVEPYKSLISYDKNRPNHLKYVRQFAEMHGHKIENRPVVPSNRDT